MGGIFTCEVLKIKIFGLLVVPLFSERVLATDRVVVSYDGYGAIVGGGGSSDLLNTDRITTAPQMELQEQIENINTNSSSTSSAAATPTRPTAAHHEGEWNPAHGYDFLLRDVDRCDWARVDVSAEDFDPEKLDYSEPMMFTNWRLNKHLQRRTQKANMLREFGEKEVILSNAVTYSHEKKRMSFSEYVRSFDIEKELGPQTRTATSEVGGPLPNGVLLQKALQKAKNATDTWYLCGDNFWNELLDEYVRPQWLPNAATGALAFGVGGTGSGIPLHRHGGALLEVTAGRKRWFVAPPGGQLRGGRPGRAVGEVALEAFTGGAPESQSASTTTSVVVDGKEEQTETGGQGDESSSGSPKSSEDLAHIRRTQAATTRGRRGRKMGSGSGAATLKLDFSGSNGSADGPPFDPEKSSFNWFHDREDELPESRILMCTQETDEALWLPDNWWHSTLNIGETVFWLLFT